jgi:superfamily II DNA or RNA helicase
LIFSPHPFQERILEALETERSLRGHTRNLVIAATGTGKTVVAAFDFKRFYRRKKEAPGFSTWPTAWKSSNRPWKPSEMFFGIAISARLQAGPYEATRLDHVFCSISMLSNRQLWEQVGETFYDYIIVDEAHHGTAASYRPIFDQFSPEILLGLTATPERMDGGNVLADFGNRIAAESASPKPWKKNCCARFIILAWPTRFPINEDRFWTNGRYNHSELEKVYTGAHILAKMRLDTILQTLEKYEPNQDAIKGVGFCVTINHARFMAEMFTSRRHSHQPRMCRDVDSDRCAYAPGKDLEIRTPDVSLYRRQVQRGG